MKIQALVSNLAKLSWIGIINLVAVFGDFLDPLVQLSESSVDLGHQVGRAVMLVPEPWLSRDIAVRALAPS